MPPRKPAAKRPAQRADTPGATPPSPPSPPADRRLALRVLTMPKDTNLYGTIFGGVILSYVDQAGFVEARRHATLRWVTASMDHVDFHAPVIVGDIVNFYTSTVRVGTTSVTIEVDVEVERWSTGQTIEVTSANLTMVAVDETGRPVPFRSKGG